MPEPGATRGFHKSRQENGPSLSELNFFFALFFLQPGRPSDRQSAPWRLSRAGFQLCSANPAKPKETKNLMGAHN